MRAESNGLKINTNLQKKTITVRFTIAIFSDY